MSPYREDKTDSMSVTLNIWPLLCPWRCLILYRLELTNNSCCVYRDQTSGAILKKLFVCCYAIPTFCQWVGRWGFFWELLEFPQQNIQVSVIGRNELQRVCVSDWNDSMYVAVIFMNQLYYSKRNFFKDGLVLYSSLDLSRVSKGVDLNVCC